VLIIRIIKKERDELKDKLMLMEKSMAELKAQLLEKEIEILKLKH
jgi:hypothetical protein